MSNFESQQSPARDDDLWSGTDDLLKVARILHPPDSVINFMRRSSGSNGKMENVGAVDHCDLVEVAPHLSQFLGQDAYMTVNGYRGKSPKLLPLTNLPKVWRREQNLRYLNAIYADLDVGRIGESLPQGMSVSQASQHLMDLVIAGDLPQFSMSAKSGRGLYLFWFCVMRKASPWSSKAGHSGKRY